MSRDYLQAHEGYTRMPWARPGTGMLPRPASHPEAVPRISWCISERAPGVIIGEVEVGADNVVVI